MITEPKHVVRWTDWRLAAVAFEEFFERRLGTMLCMATVIYFGAMLVQSAFKPLWYDELVTHYLAALPITRLWDALISGAEIHPPLSMMEAHAIQLVLGPTALASRMPEIVAFWVMSLALFFLVRSDLGSSWAMAAVLFVFASDAEYYATEARPYAILMCCAIVAMLSWRKLHGPWRWFYLKCIFFSIAAGVSAEFMAVLIPVPIAIGELFRMRQKRRIDLAFWIAVIAGVSVILLYLPIMRLAQRYVPHNSQGAGHTASLLVLFGLLLLPVIPTAAAALIGLWITCGLPGDLGALRAKPGDRTGVRLPELAAAAALFLLPLGQIALEHWTRSVNPRYTVEYVIGASLLFTYGCAWLFRRTRTAGFVFLLFFVSAIAIGACMRFRAERKAPPWPPAIKAAEIPELPILVDQGFHYLPIYWYNPALQSRMYFVDSSEDALRVSGADTVELNLLFARDWLPVKLAQRSQFYHPGSKFLYYESGVDGVMFPDWQMQTMRRMKANISLAKRLTPTDVLYKVEIPQ